MNRDSNKVHKEIRHLVIYGYTKQELSKLLKHFQAQLPEFVKTTISGDNLLSTITLTGINSGLELLRFQMNKYQQQLQDLFSEELVSTEQKGLPEVLGDMLLEKELTVSCAESCTGGNIAHKIVSIAGSSDYFMGSVVSYSNEVKAEVLGVSRSDIDRYGAVSQEVAEQMACGAAKLMHTDCAIATTGIAGPGGGTKFKPVGTVWFAVKCADKMVSECINFKGNRHAVIGQATNHALNMLINLLRNYYSVHDDIEEE